MNVGDTAQCALLHKGKRTGAYVQVEIREIRRHWQTGEPLRYRVRFQRQGKDGFLWVQAEMLRPAEGKGIAPCPSK